jgi:recombination protein RecT
MNAPATKETGPVAQFSGFLDKFKPQLELALPKHLNVDRMARLALTSFSTSPKLQKCEPRTIAASLMVAGQLGLEPGVNGQGWLIPYKTTCTFVPGWKGLVDLVNRAGRATVYTGVIFSDQRYTFTDGAKRDLLVHNETELDAPEDITHAYAIGWVKDASMPVIEFWPVKKIRKHRDKYNKVGSDHYSFRDWEMYCRKIPLLQVLKYMPQSIELSNAIAASYAAEEGRGVTIDGFGVVVENDGNGGGDDTPPPPDYYPEEAFAAELAKTWAPLLASGKKKPEQAIAALRTKHPLSEEQVAAVHAAAKARPAQSETDKLIDKMRAAADVDTLDAHADLIGTLPADDQQNATAIYRARRTELSK